MSAAPLPDDPAAACRAIAKAVYEIEGGRDREPSLCAVTDLAALVIAVLDGGDAADRQPTCDALVRAAMRAETEAERINEWLSRIRDLARHADPEARAFDAQCAARRAAFESGQPMPYEPTAGDVAAAERILKALGRSWTMQEIIACLRDAEADG